MFDIEEMKAPFPLTDVEWRIGHSGNKDGNPWAMVLCYVTNRAIMKRLDDVVGAMNWKNQYQVGPGGGILCGISIYNFNIKEWITKWDGAGNTDIEAVKGGLSDAMKRAAVQWGIGRYLYKLDATFADCFNDKTGRHKANMPKDKNNKSAGYIYYTWNEPQLPQWALPGYKSRLMLHNEAVQKHLESVMEVKKCLLADDFDGAAEAFAEIPEEDRQALALASTKGGIYTLEETAKFRDPRWSEARQRHLQDK